MRFTKVCRAPITARPAGFIRTTANCRSGDTARELPHTGGGQLAAVLAALGCIPQIQIHKYKYKMQLQKDNLFSGQPHCACFVASLNWNFAFLFQHCNAFVPSPRGNLASENFKELKHTHTT